MVEDEHSSSLKDPLYFVDELLFVFKRSKVMKSHTHDDSLEGIIREGNGLARRLDCLELVSEAILVDFEVELREHSLVDVNTHCLVIEVMKGKEVVLSPTAHIS